MEELRFTAFVVDLCTRKLTRAARDPRIGSRTLDRLKLLVLNRDRFGSRDAITKAG